MATTKSKVPSYKRRAVTRASKAALSAQKAQNYAVRKAAQANKIKVNKMAENIRATGQAISGITTPFAAQLATKSYSEQKSAREISKSSNTAASAALAEWKSIMSGNPDVQSGESGSSQKGSTSVLD